MNRKTIILGFDMETDIGSWTMGDKGLTKGGPEILRILRNHKIQATFFFTGREAQNHPKLVRQIRAAGHEIGCHTMFHETIGNAVFDMPGANFVLPDEVPGRLELATRAVQQIAGIRPVSFRAPRLFGSTEMIRILEDLGYLADSSFPCYFHGRDFRPYHPSAKDWSKPGKMRILEIPVFYDTEGSQGGTRHRGRDQWPMLRLKGGPWFAHLCRRMMPKARNHDGDAVLCVYLHPWEFVTMPRTIRTDEATITFNTFLHKNCGRTHLNALDAFIEAMIADGVRFTTMQQFAREYE